MRGAYGSRSTIDRSVKNATRPRDCSGHCSGRLFPTCWTALLVRSILLLRHGQTSWNLAGRWQGWLDVELDDIGREQARRRARDLAAEGTRFVGVASSP